MNPKVLFVDDDANILASYKRNLRKEFSVDTALGPEQGLASLALHGPYAVVVADMQMPLMNGIQFLCKVEEGVPETVRLMLTGNADQKTAADAVNEGHVFRFLTKPCPHETLCKALEAAISQDPLITAERELLENTLNGAVKILMDVLSAVDPQSFGRSERVRDYMQIFLRMAPVAQEWELELAAMLAPIGRVTLPATVLMKDRSGLTVTAIERDMVARVPEVGAELLGQIPRLENVSRIVRYQATNFVGSGMHEAETIPMGARILRVLCDLVDLEIKGISKAAALKQMKNANGCYDPGILDTAFRAFDVTDLKHFQGQAESVRVCELVSGQVLAEDVKTTEGVLVLTSGSTLSTILVQRLQNFRELGTIPDTVLVCQRRIAA